MTHPSPTCTLVQLTDLHIVEDGEELPGGVDTAAVLAEALDAVEASALRPAALVLTGDLAEHGRPAQYRRLRAIVEPVAARTGAQLVYVAGNHDDRAALREHLMDEPPSADPLDHTVRVGDLRIIALDSTVPGQGHGELTPQQLERLRGELAEPAPSGTVLAVHHPPLPSAAPLAASIPLLRRGDLAAAVAGTDVRLVLAGHTHVVSSGTLAGVPVWTGGPLATTLDPFAPGAALRGLATPSVSRIDLFPDALITTSVPIGARRMSDVPAATMEPAITAFRAVWSN
ncbi:calcineurin-like phosphoesterase family protein [Pseudonocardia hierapolitana]|uniref:Calcineurin-like phosphoesterase family protein n=1 Tax=Pseudonocardia hierapolitana TaxID=1128676 RepID=A0A561T259_9PSEU|nr:metallophosphoesterase [Pseudonocardia hierapolitana]TWF81197.1 calcineurin-like phosphoesterase family protein [Pseudonocardia hierapolitana]